MSVPDKVAGRIKVYISLGYPFDIPDTLYLYQDDQRVEMTRCWAAEFWPKIKDFAEGKEST